MGNYDSYSDGVSRGIRGKWALSGHSNHPRLQR